jgi:LytR cell envelope-related transcriptional attenuator
VTGGTYLGQINSVLQNGPQCQVAADHELTGITITGYIMFDFDKADVPVSVYHADGVTGRAGKLASALASAGFAKASSAGDLPTAASTDVYYPDGD